MKKNTKYIVLGGTLVSLSLLLLIVASATTVNTCTTCPEQKGKFSQNHAFANAAVTRD